MFQRTSLIAAAMTLSLSFACTYESSSLSGFSCDEEGTVEDDRVCVDGVWVEQDGASGDMTGTEDMSGDMPTDMTPTDACVPVSDEELCARLAPGDACGDFEGVEDNCGALRDVSCGCEGAKSCVPLDSGGLCSTCNGESDEELCAEAGRACGMLSGIIDRCGTSREVASCGECAMGQACTAEGACSGECVPESDDELCMGQGAECGALTLEDACGDMRTIDCGECEQGSCLADNTCSACTPESDDAFCARLSAECGLLSGADNCGQMREDVDCGMCADGERCDMSNTCACPMAECPMGAECGGATNACGSMTFCGALMGACASGEICGDNLCEERVTLTNPMPQAASDRFGHSVALDGETLVVGAPGKEGNQGRVYVYERDAWTRAWALSATLEAPAAASGDYFGYSVDVDAASGRLIASAPLRDITGEVFVFTRQPDGTWSTAAETISAPATTDSRFGLKVAIDANRAIVGSPRSKDPLDLLKVSGLTYIFERSSGAWIKAAELLPASDSNNYIGWDVDIQGDRAILSAPGKDSGQVYVYARDNAGLWQPDSNGTLTASDLDGSDWFGFAVALDGERALASAPDYEPTGMGRDDHGLASFFETSGTWTEQQLPYGYTPANNEYFGFDVALDGDLAAVSKAGVEGDPSKNSATRGTSSSSSALFYRLSGGTWSLARTVTTMDSGDRYVGYSIAVSGDLGAVGAPHRTTGDDHVYIVRVD